MAEEYNITELIPQQNATQIVAKLTLSSTLACSEFCRRSFADGYRSRYEYCTFQRNDCFSKNQRPLVSQYSSVNRMSLIRPGVFMNWHMLRAAVIIIFTSNYIMMALFWIPAIEVKARGVWRGQNHSHTIIARWTRISSGGRYVTAIGSGLIDLGTFVLCTPNTEDLYKFQTGPHGGHSNILTASAMYVITMTLTITVPSQVASRHHRPYH